MRRRRDSRGFKEVGVRWWGWVILLLLVPAIGCAPKRVLTPYREPVIEKGDPDDDPAMVLDADQPAQADQRETSPDPGEDHDAGRGSTPEQVTLGLRAASLAREQVGKQYQWGASGPDKFDCSGLVQFVYGHLGIDLPRVSRHQARAGRDIPRKQIQPGDLLFFALNGSGIDHVGIYIGRQQFVHAPRRHQPVRTDTLNNHWWRQRLKEARRIP